jgi:hypothetical protein
MKELNKTNKFVHKMNVYTLLYDRLDINSFERELEKMVSNGDIC